MPLALFDLDGTLVDQRRAARSWVAELVAAGTVAESHLDVIAEALAAGRPKGEVFAELVSRLSLPTSSEGLWSAYRARMPQLVRCEEEDMAALDRLRDAGWTTGIVTNGQADNQVAKIRSTGLASQVHGWVVSSEIGIRKPDPGIFHAMAARLGQPLTGWMIGDGMVADIGGGASVGLSTVLITDEEPPPQGDIRPSATAPDVAHAVDLILGAPTA